MDRNGTRLAAQIDESQNRPFTVFGRLPRIEEEIRIIDGKKACLIAIERPRQIERLVLRADLVLLQRCRFFPPMRLSAAASGLLQVSARFCCDENR